MGSADQPATDEFEVTLLGRGVGESCVVHYGAGEWMIVDSLWGGKSPAPLEYLRDMGVAAGQVKHLVLTHFDRDHYVGIAELHDEYSMARLWITAALQQERFLQAYSRTSTDESGLRSTMLRARRRMLTATTPGLATLGAGTVLIDRPPLRIVALSPSEAAVDAACQGLADRMGDGDLAAVRGALARDNRCSVALHVNWEGTSVLLAGDVEAKPLQFGWQAVLDEERNDSLEPVGLIKVPHHGSVGAHHPAMWERLVIAGAPMFVAPFTSLPRPIPTVDDWGRLLALGRLWQAAPSAPVASGRIFAEDGTRRLVRTSRSVGVVRARRRASEDEWRVEVTEPAFEVSLRMLGEPGVD